MKIEMIPAVKEQDDYLMIPVYSTNDYCHILWKEGENMNDALANASPEKFKSPAIWDKISVIASDIDRSLLPFGKVIYRKQ